MKEHLLFSLSLLYYFIISYGFLLISMPWFDIYKKSSYNKYFKALLQLEQYVQCLVILPCCAEMTVTVNRTRAFHGSF